MCEVVVVVVVCVFVCVCECVCVCGGRDNKVDLSQKTRIGKNDVQHSPLITNFEGIIFLLVVSDVNISWHSDRTNFLANHSFYPKY